MINETKFPEAEEDDYYLAGTYSQVEVDDWFKRCIKDFPEMVDRHHLDWAQAVLIWKSKWLSQFIEKGEENDS